MSTHAVYASLEEAARAIGVEQTSGVDDRLALALILASRWVDYRVGRTSAADLDTSLTRPYEVTVVARPAGQVMATLSAAVRFYAAPDVPFGVLSVGDIGMAVRSSIPEAELHLLGQRTAWGIA
jgi:hypothetical protein